MRRKTLDEYYEQGVRCGKEGRPPNPVQMDRYCRMAYTAGWQEGKREYEACKAFILETVANP